MIRRLIRISLAAAGLALGLAGPAFAHAHLKSAAPADKSTVTASPRELDLAFTEGLDLKFSGVTITGPDKKAVKTGQAMLMQGGTVLMVPISETLPAGIYAVEWHVLSTDGHKTSGSYSFTVKP